MRHAPFGHERLECEGTAVNDVANAKESKVPEPSKVSMAGLDELIGTKMRYAYLFLRRGFAERLGPIGLTQTQCATMWLLDANPGVSQTELADVLDVDRVTMIGVIEKLARSGLISRTRSSTDGRRRNLALSKKGKDLFERAKEEILTHDREFASSLSPGELMVLKEILEKISLRRP